MENGRGNKLFEFVCHFNFKKDLFRMEPHLILKADCISMEVTELKELFGIHIDCSRLDLYISVCCTLVGQFTLNSALNPCTGSVESKVWHKVAIQFTTVYGVPAVCAQLRVYVSVFTCLCGFEVMSR